MENIKKKLGITQYESDDIKLLIHSNIARAVYNHKNKKVIESKPANWYDKVKCDICGREFTRSARSQHKKTKLHIAYDDMNQKLKKLLLN